MKEPIKVTFVVIDGDKSVRVWDEFDYRIDVCGVMDYILSICKVIN